MEEVWPGGLDVDAGEPRWSVPTYNIRHGGKWPWDLRMTLHPPEVPANWVPLPFRLCFFLAVAQLLGRFA